eukprot:c30632_g1_i1 orf=59-460(+)
MGIPALSFEVGFVKPKSHVVTNDSPLETAQFSELHEVRNAICTPCSGLNESNNTTAQGYRDAINLNNFGTIDTMVSSQGGDAVEGLITAPYSGKEQGNSANEEFALKLIGYIDVSFEDLKLCADYTALYVGRA